MNNEVRQMKTPYLNLRQKRNNNSKPYLMLSELIDNSIGSWNDHKMSSNLTVNLTIDILGKRIVCSDNAFGMNEDELLDSVEMDKEKQGNNINMFGVGMKNAAFWFGQDLIIKSNNGNQYASTFVKLSNVKNFNLPVEWKIENLPRRRFQGTDVFIENVYDDRLLTEEEIKLVVTILETKYRKYLIGNGNKQVFIHIDVIDKIGETTHYELEPHPVKAQVIAPDRVDDFLKNLDAEFKNKEIILHGLKQQAIEKAKEGKPLLFIFPIKFRNDTFELEIGITKQPDVAGKDKEFFRPNFGITAYQRERAIRIAGVNPLEFPKQDYTRTDIKRVHGSCELGHIFRPDNNKSDFNFGIYRDTFNTILANIGKDIIRLATAVANTIKLNSIARAGTKKASRGKLERALGAKSNGFKWIQFKEFDTKLSFNDKDGELWTVVLSEVSIDDHNASEYFINAEINKKNDKEIIIKYNVNHPIWKPLVNDSNAIDLKTVTFPLVTILGLSKVGIENNLMSNWLKQDTDDYLEVISELAKFGLKA